MVIAEPEEHDIRRSSSRGIIPKAKIKTVKMTFVIVLGQYNLSDLNVLKNYQI